MTIRFPPLFPKPVLIVHLSKLNPKEFNRFLRVTQEQIFDLRSEFFFIGSFDDAEAPKRAKIRYMGVK